MDRVFCHTEGEAHTRHTETQVLKELRPVAQLKAHSILRTATMDMDRVAQEVLTVVLLACLHQGQAHVSHSRSLCRFGLPDKDQVCSCPRATSNKPDALRQP